MESYSYKLTWIIFEYVEQTSTITIKLQLPTYISTFFGVKGYMILFIGSAVSVLDFETMILWNYDDTVLKKSGSLNLILNRGHNYRNDMN